MKNQPQGLFLVWKKYQRRPEVLAPLVDCQLKFMPHWFKSKFLRPIDYLIKLISSIFSILRHQPDFVIAQTPPTFSAIPALITRTPYVIDAHNPLFQVEMWQKLPLTQTLIANSAGVIAHNVEIKHLAAKMYPEIELFKISDPVEVISSSPPVKRQAKQILIISSFDPWDEPVELLVATIAQLQDYNFIITADINKLSPPLREQLQQMPNLRLTGFVPTQEYHHLLCSSQAALVLTTSDATQPSGACEALSSDTQLVISKTSLTEKLYGEWAVLVDNSLESIVAAIRSLSVQEINLSIYRKRWNDSVKQDIVRFNQYIEKLIVN